MFLSNFRVKILASELFTLHKRIIILSILWRFTKQAKVKSVVKTLLENNFHNNYFSIYCIDIDKAVTGSSQSTLLQVEVSLPMNLFQFSISYELVVNMLQYDFSGE